MKCPRPLSVLPVAGRAQRKRRFPALPTIAARGRGADTTPTFMTPSTSRPINVAHTGTPRTKLAVPSIGSSTQRREAAAGTPHPAAPHLLAEDGVARPFLFQELTNGRLGGPVGFAYRGVVCLCLNGQGWAAEGLEGYRRRPYRRLAVAS